jgi:hypothetical protein
MGYCYELRGGRKLLVCEACEKADGTVRRKACPAGWCPADALCSGCRKDPAVKAKLAEGHAGCAEASARYRAEKAAEEALLAAGEYVLCARATVERGVSVKITFRNAAGDTKDLVVTSALSATTNRLSTYDAVLSAATAEYEAGKAMAAERAAALAALDAEYGADFGALA